MKVIIGWVWDFGDRGTSKKQNPVHKYPEIDSSYITKLTIITNKGKEATYSQEVNPVEDTTIRGCVDNIVWCTILDNCC